MGFNKQTGGLCYRHEKVTVSNRSVQREGERNEKQKMEMREKTKKGLHGITHGKTLKVKRKRKRKNRKTKKKKQEEKGRTKFVTTFKIKKNTHKSDDSNY